MANETIIMMVNILRIVPPREEVLLQLHQGLQGAADVDGKFKYTFFSAEKVFLKNSELICCSGQTRRALEDQR